MRPLGKRVLVKRDEIGEAKVGSFYIPETSQEKPLEGSVVSFALGVKGLNEGDKVLFGKYAGQEVKVQGKEYLLLHEDEVLLVL